MQQDWSSKQYPSYHVGRWFDALLQPRIAERREFLAQRNARGRSGSGRFGSYAGDGGLRCEQMGRDTDEGWED